MAVDINNRPSTANPDRDLNNMFLVLTAIALTFALYVIGVS